VDFRWALTRPISFSRHQLGRAGFGAELVVTVKENAKQAIAVSL